MDSQDAATRDSMVKRLVGFSLLVMLLEWVIRTIEARSATGSRSVHTSILQGESYVQELLTEKRGRRIFRALGVSTEEFHHILKELKDHGGLRDSKWVTATEQLAVFLSCMHKGLSNRQLMERWQHSGSMISEIFHVVQASFLQVASRWISPPNARLQAGVVDNTNMYPWFQHCVGAIDGTHVPVVLRQDVQDAYKSRKKCTTQNCMFAVDFDTRIRYMLAGWEGSAHDGRVLKDAERKGFVIPHGKYVLADAGYGRSNVVLTPFKGVMYHLTAWGTVRQGGLKREPATRQELFNLHHAQARNVVERTFGIMKSKWMMLREISLFDIETQTDIVICCSIIHNMMLPPVLPSPPASTVVDSDKFSPLGHLNMEKYRHWLSVRMWVDYKRQLMSP